MYIYLCIYICVIIQQAFFANQAARPVDQTTIRERAVCPFPLRHTKYLEYMGSFILFFVKLFFGLGHRRIGNIPIPYNKHPDMLDYDSLFDGSNDYSAPT